MDPGTALTTTKAGFDLMAKVRSLHEQLFKKHQNGEEKAEGEQLLSEAEEQLKIAKAQIADGFHYPLCPRHFFVAGR